MSPIMTFRRDVPAGDASAGLVRSFLTDWLIKADLVHIKDDVLSVAGELVINGLKVCARCQKITVIVTRMRDGVLVEVHDPGPGTPRVRRAAAAGLADVLNQEDNGWGLLMVERLATRSGVRRLTDGKTVWAWLEHPS